MTIFVVMLSASLFDHGLAVGNCDQPAKVKGLGPSLLLMGGGTDVDAGFRFLINASNAGALTLLLCLVIMFASQAIS